MESVLSSIVNFFKICGITLDNAHFDFWNQFGDNVILFFYNFWLDSIFWFIFLLSFVPWCFIGLHT